MTPLEAAEMLLQDSLQKTIKESVTAIVSGEDRGGWSTVAKLFGDPLAEQAKSWIEVTVNHR